MPEGSVRAGAGPLVLTDETFDAAIRSAPLVLVDFWASWCVPCRMVGHAVDAIARDHGDRLLVARLNVDENPRTRRRQGIDKLPTLLVFRSGRVVDVLIGAVSRPSLDRFLTSWL